MKRILIVAGLLVGLSVNAAVLSTNVAAGGTYLLSTNRMSVYSIEIASTYANLVSLFDANSLAAPYYGTNYTTAAYPYTTSYVTNIASSYVGSNGYTNWYTNSYLWTITATNAAATNALTPLVSHAVAAGTYGIYNEDALFVNGMTMRALTNVNIVINYRSGR